MVETLTSKVKAWELDNRVPFLYDKVISKTVLSSYTHILTLDVYPFFSA